VRGRTAIGGDGLDTRAAVLQPIAAPYERTATMPTRRPRITALLITALLVTALPMTAAAARPIKPPPPPDPGPISWSGHDWHVKSHSRKIGPGPNFFSSENVELVGDELHLSISRSGNKWYAAEVINTESFGYGTYSWTVGPMGPLDPQVVLGLFTWNDDPAYNHREIDFEYAKWGNAADPTNAQYVVQPWDSPGNDHRWEQTVFNVSITHSFTWAEDSVEFRSTTADGRLLQEWTYTGPDVPVPGGENARMNLWLFRGSAPQNGLPVTVVLESFSHTPLP
jgi:endo-1,3-1,4-beta-glycanase ExoK